MELCLKSVFTLPPIFMYLWSSGSFMLITEEIIVIAVRKWLEDTGPSCLVLHVDTHIHRTSSCYVNV